MHGDLFGRNAGESPIFLLFGVAINYSRTTEKVTFRAVRHRPTIISGSVGARESEKGQQVVTLAVVSVKIAISAENYGLASSPANLAVVFGLAIVKVSQLVQANAIGVTIFQASNGV